MSSSRSSSVGFWRNVTSVLSGTAISQAIPIAGSLVLARQYAPDEFGTFAAWLGLVLLLSVVATGRIENALPIETDGEPRKLAFIGVVATVSVAAVLCCVGLLLYLSLTAPSSRFFPLWMTWAFVPSGVGMAIATAWQSWAAAEGAYRSLSIMRIAQAAVVTLAQIVAGEYSPTGNSLAAGQLVGVALGLLMSAHVMPVGALSYPRLVIGLRYVWTRHRRFPIISLPADAVSTLSAQLPVLIISARFGADAAGLLAMATRVLGAPISLLGKSVLDVFKRHAAQGYILRGDCRVEYLSTLRVLSVASVMFILCTFAFGELVFVLLLGADWRQSGVVALWLAPLFALRFIASPLSYVVYIVGRLKIDLLWQLALLLATLLTLGLSSTVESAIKIYVYAYSILYLAYLYMSYRFSGGQGK